MLESFFGEPVVSLRTAARAIHHLSMVYAALADKRLVLGTTTATLVIVRTLDRELYYRFVDGRASDADVVDGVVDRLGEDACARHGREMTAFEAWAIASQRERDRGDGWMFDGLVETPLMRRYGEIGPEDGAQDDGSATKAQKHASEVLGLLRVIDRDSGSFQGIKFKAVLARLRLRPTRHVLRPGGG